MEAEDYKKWKEYLTQEKPEFLDELEIFKDSCFPVIFSMYHLSQLIGIKTDVLSRIINSPENFYRQFTIKKRSGGERQITAPYPVLKSIQEWILKNILEHISLNDAAKGFRKNTTIIDNVLPHLGQKNVLKIDIKDFFPSITFNRVFMVFKNCGYSHQVTYYLARLCSLENSLPQGACTSPYLANVVSKRLDSRLYNLAEKTGLAYTRYADDITFSGKKINVKLCNFIFSIIQNEGFEINIQKAKLLRNCQKKIITGISINDTIPKLPRTTKRKWRQDAYIVLRQSKDEYIEKYFKKDPVYLERLIGKFTFWHFIEKENEYVISTLKKLKTYSIYLSQSI